MTQLDRRLQQRKLREQLAAEFPEFELVNWYIQYRELKAAHPDAVLLYRLGDFYETFDDDAKLIADLPDELDGQVGIKCANFGQALDRDDSHLEHGDRFATIGVLGYALKTHDRSGAAKPDNLPLAIDQGAVEFCPPALDNVEIAPCVALEKEVIMSGDLPDVARVHGNPTARRVIEIDDGPAVDAHVVDSA